MPSSMTCVNPEIPNPLAAIISWKSQRFKPLGELFSIKNAEIPRGNSQPAILKSFAGNLPLKSQEPPAYSPYLI